MTECLMSGNITILTIYLLFYTLMWLIIGMIIQYLRQNVTIKNSKNKGDTNENV